MKKTGRPKKELDWSEVEKLCYIQCSINEIAWWFGCSTDTIERACKRDLRMPFAEYFEQKKGKGKIALKRRLFQSANAGKTAELIFALKNYCGLVDAYETKNKTSLEMPIEFKIGFDDEPGTDTAADIKPPASKENPPAKTDS